MVRCLDNKTAKRINAKNPPEVIFFDPDGEEIYRKNVTSQRAVDAAFQVALGRYKDEPVAWSDKSYDETARDAKENKLVAMIFIDDKKNSKKKKLRTKRADVRKKKRSQSVALPPLKHTP